MLKAYQVDPGEALMFTKMLATLSLIISFSIFPLYAQQDEEGAAGGFDLDALLGGITGGADKTGDGTTADGGADTTGDGTTADGGADKTGDGTTADGSTDKTGDGTTADGSTDKEDAAIGKESGGTTDKEDAAIGGESDGSKTATTLFGGNGPTGKTTTPGTAPAAAAPAPQIIYKTVPGGTTTRIEKTIIEKPGKKKGNNWWAPALAGVAGLVGGIAIGSSTKKSSKSGVCKYKRYAIVGKDAQGENIYDCDRQGTWYINQRDGLFYPINSQRTAPAARAAPANRNQRYSRGKSGYYPDAKGKYLMNSKGKYYLPQSKKK